MSEIGLKKSSKLFFRRPREKTKTDLYSPWRVEQIANLKLCSILIHKKVMSENDKGGFIYFLCNDHLVIYLLKILTKMLTFCIFFIFRAIWKIKKGNVALKETFLIILKKFFKNVITQKKANSFVLRLTKNIIK